MANKQEFLDSIQPNMSLEKDFYLKIYGYDVSYAGFAEQVLAKLESLGYDLARNTYTCIVAEWEHSHKEMMKNVAQWYAKQNFYRKEETSRKQLEKEQMKGYLQQMSDKQLLTLLQNLRQETSNPQ